MMPLGKRQMGVALVGWCWLAVMAFGTAVNAQTLVKVESGPKGLSVDARESTLPAILQAVGAKVEFQVVDAGGARPLLNFSARNKSLEEVLSQLLAGERHAITYAPTKGKSRQGAPRIASVVLMGPLTDGRSETSKGMSQTTRRTLEALDQSRTQTKPGASSSAPTQSDPGSAVPDDSQPRQDNKAGAAVPQAVSVQAMLLNQAVLPRASTSPPGGAIAGESGGSSPASPPPTMLSPALQEQAVQQAKGLAEALKQASTSLANGNTIR
jgi:hypothetical protein